MVFRLLSWLEFIKFSTYHTGTEVTAIQKVAHVVASRYAIMLRSISMVVVSSNYILKT
jgi:hypothetical protein